MHFIFHVLEGIYMSVFISYYILQLMFFTTAKFITPINKVLSLAVFFWFFVFKFSADLFCLLVYHINTYNVG